MDEQIEKKSMNKRWVFVLALIGVVVIALTGIKVYSDVKEQNEDELFQKIEEVCADLDKGDYTSALVKAEALPKKYQQYYIDYITYAKELETWAGSGEDLVAWMQQVNETGDRHREMSFPDSFFVKSAETGVLRYSLWSSRYDVSEDGFEWYKELQQIKERYYISYWETILTKSDYSMGEITEKLEEAYNQAITELSALKSECPRSEWGDRCDSYAEFWEDMYCEHAATLIVQERGSSLFNLTANMLDIQDLMIEDDWGIPFELANYNEEIEDYMRSLSPPTMEVVLVIRRVFGGAMPVITEDIETFTPSMAYALVIDKDG